MGLQQKSVLCSFWDTIVKRFRLYFTVWLVIFAFLLGSCAKNGISFEYPVLIQCLDSHRPFGVFHFKRFNSNYYDKLPLL